MSTAPPPPRPLREHLPLRPEHRLIHPHPPLHRPPRARPPHPACRWAALDTLITFAHHSTEHVTSAICVDGQHQPSCRPQPQRRPMTGLAGTEEPMSIDSPLLPGFTPTDVQLSVLKDPSRRLLLTAANRFGKTVLGMSRVLYCARGNYPYSPIPPGETYWVFCPSWKNFGQVHEPIFKEMCPATWIRHYNSSKRRATICREAGGTATIQWWTYEQDPQKLTKAPPPHGCWMDDRGSSRAHEWQYDLATRAASEERLDVADADAPSSR